MLDPAARMVTSDGQPIELPPREFTLLQELMLNAGRVLSRQQLEERIYRCGDEVESNAVEVHVHHLRRKHHREQQHEELASDRALARLTPPASVGLRVTIALPRLVA